MTRTILRYLLWTAAALALAGFAVSAWQTFAQRSLPDPVETSILGQAAGFAGVSTPPLATRETVTPVLPMFPWTVSLLMRLFDAAIWQPRLVSLLATLLVATAAFLVVRGETKSATLGVAAAGLLLMSQGAGGTETVGARPETLMLLLAITGCVVLRFSIGITGALLGAILFAAASFTHPAGLVFAFAALFHLRVMDPRRMVAYGLALVLLMCGVQWGLMRGMGPLMISAPWHALLHAARFAPVTVLQLVGRDLLGALGVLTLATVLSFALPTAPWRGAGGIWTWMAFGAVAVGLLATQTGGSAGDALRSMAAMLVIVGPLSAQRITHHLSNWPGGSRMGAHAVVLTALALQFVTLFASGAS